jgi:hypothetical protein
LQELWGVDPKPRWFWMTANYGFQNSIKTSAGSSTSQSTTWPTEEWFGFCVGKDNLLKMMGLPTTE